MTDKFIQIQTGIPRNQLYPMLRFCLNAIECDIDNPSHLKECFGTIRTHFFSGLPPKHGLDLLTRLRTAKGDENLIDFEFSSSIFGNNPFDDSHSDPNLLQTVLLQRSGYQNAAEDLALRQIQSRKKMAMSAATPEKRAVFAKSVVNYAIASGSLDMYRQELIWARRFIRDPAAVNSIYPCHVQEAVVLLAGIPQTGALDKNFPAAQLGERIKLGNQIVREMFETVFLALREPWFDSSQVAEYVLYFQSFFNWPC